MKEGDIKVGELNEQANATKEIERAKAIYELELFEWGEQCRRVQDKITKVKYENQIQMAKQKLIDDEELDQKKAHVNQDAKKFIDEIERNIHLEN